MSGSDPESGKTPEADEPTPPEHQVLALRIEAALLPEWFDLIRAVAARHARRMAVLEKPDEWVVRVELHTQRIPAFSEDLTEQWETFVAERRAAGRWEAEPEGEE